VRIRRFSTGFIVAIAALGAAGPATASHDRGQPPCGTITRASVTLTRDCAAPLVIAKTGARVNLGGHRVECTDHWEDYWLTDPRVGIRIANRRAVHVSNGIVIGCGRGIYVTGGRSHRLTELRVLYNGFAEGGGGNGVGIYIGGGAHNLVADSRIINNGGPGIWLDGASRNRIVRNTLTWNFGSVQLTGGSWNYVDSNIISGSTGEWTAAIEGGSSTVIRWNRIDETGWRYSGDGIVAGQGAIVRGNHVTRSQASAIRVVSPGARVIGNTVIGNGFVGWAPGEACGIQLQNTGALVTENTVTGNWEGICATGTGNRITLNVAGSSVGGEDLRDETGGCLGNLWQGNTFGTRFPDCIG
jgi:parallel beta-helix repeat protein